MTIIFTQTTSSPIRDCGWASTLHLSERLQGGISAEGEQQRHRLVSIKTQIKSEPMRLAAIQPPKDDTESHYT